eukprot:30962-Prymnesium_polylepis.1
MLPPGALSDAHPAVIALHRLRAGVGNSVLDAYVGEVESQSLSIVQSATSRDNSLRAPEKPKALTCWTTPPPGTLVGATPF